MLRALLEVVWTEMCVGSVFTQPPYNDKNPPSFFFFYLLNSLTLSQIKPSVCVTSHGRSPLPRLLIDSSVSAQTALVSYLRPALSELSSVVSPPEEMQTRMTPKQLRCFVVGCNNEHSSRHLLPSSEQLKRITFGFEGNAPSIYLNASMFTWTIRDPASSTEEVSTRFFKWIFARERREGRGQQSSFSFKGEWHKYGLIWKEMFLIG